MNKINITSSAKLASTQLMAIFFVAVFGALLIPGFAAADPVAPRQLESLCKENKTLIKKAKKNKVNVSKLEKVYKNNCKNVKSAGIGAATNKKIKALQANKEAIAKATKSKAKAAASKKYKKECNTKAKKKTSKCKRLAEKFKGGKTDPASGKLGGVKPGALKKVDAKSIGVPTTAANEGTLKSLLNGAYQLAGVIAVIAIIIAALRMIVGSDNPETVATSRRAIIYASAGLIVIISAFVITQFVINVGST